MDEISKRLKEHYRSTFVQHGATSNGVDWGTDESRLHCRYDKMLAVIRNQSDEIPSLLDVGCGFGGLLSYARSIGTELNYTGVDVCDEMIDWAKKHFGDSASFICKDILEIEENQSFDYVICNGILTQKLETEGQLMDLYAGRLIRKMFSMCRSGIAFNVMTTKVNYFSNNLYYRNPAELFSWCLSEITPYIKLDHAYPLYEYTISLYRTQSVDDQERS